MRRMPDFVRKSVIFIGNKDAKTGRFRPRATGFIVEIRQQQVGFRFVVTAEHNIVMMQQKGWEIYFRSNLKDGGAREDSWKDANWWFHPDNERSPTDVAVAGIDFHPEEDFRALLLRSDDPKEQPISFGATSEELDKLEFGLGNNVTIVGLFRSHYGQQRNVPITRVGNLAMMRGEPVYTKYCGYTDAYLVEARSIGGLSGSPVFIHNSIPVARSETTPGMTQTTKLLGLMHGHFDVRNLNEDIVLDSDQDASTGINTGIGVVIPTDKILETIDHPELVEMRRTAISEHRKSLGASADLAKDDPLPNDENPKHREDFTRLVGAAARTPPPKD